MLPFGHKKSEINEKAFGLQYSNQMKIISTYIYISTDKHSMTDKFYDQSKTHCLCQYYFSNKTENNNVVKTGYVTWDLTKMVTELRLYHKHHTQY